MAEGFARHLGGKDIQAFSAGSRPAGFVADGAVQTMQEIGIDISDQASKSVETFRNQDFDAVVTMGCGDACPWVPARSRIDWQIPDPIGHSQAFFREVRETLKSKVAELIEILKKTRE